MKKQIIIIHGGDTFDTYEEYLQYLKIKEVSLEKIKNKRWKDNLDQKLGSEYDVIFPKMPNMQNAKYLEWKIWFEKLIPLLQDEIILLRQSLGAMFLVKYLSENKLSKKVKATFLIAPPYKAKVNESLADFNISENLQGLADHGGEIFIYQSKDDKVVPFLDSKEYEKRLPKAKMRIFEDRGHFLQQDFPEIIDDIKSIN